jgi:hypothetical protein
MLASVIETTMRESFARRAEWIGMSWQEEEKKKRVETTVETPRIGVIGDARVT